MDLLGPPLIPDIGTTTEWDLMVDLVPTEVVDPPTVSISLSKDVLYVGETALITITFSQQPRGFTVANITAPNGTLSLFGVTGSPLVYTVLFTPTAGISDPSNAVSVDVNWSNFQMVPPMGVTSSPNYSVETDFLKNDEFNTALAAGAVNGTASEPGPGMRTVTDAENKISVVDSLLANAGGKATPAWGDPALFLDSEARVVGKMLIEHFNFSYIGSGGGVNLGWGTDTSVAMLKAHGIYFGTSKTIAMYDNNAQDIPLGAQVLAINSNYYLLIALRGTGAFYFVKGGVFTDWTLIWISRVNSTTPLYPALSNKNGIFNSEYIHVPSALWLPTPLVSDGFSAAASDGLGHAETSGVGAGGNGVAWTGATWSVGSGVVSNTPSLGVELAAGNLVIGTWYKITASDVDHFYTGSAVNDTFRATAATALDANNKVKALTLSELFRTVALSTPDVFVDVQLPAIGTVNQTGWILRADSASNPQNFLLVYRTKGNLIKVVECVAGTYSADILSVSNTFAANEHICVDVFGSAVRVYKLTAAGVTTLIGAGTTSILAGNIHGILATVPTSTFDNLIVYSKAYTDTLLKTAARVKSRTGAILLNFDDAVSSVYSQAYSYMATKGMVGTAFPISVRVGTPGYATWTQLQEMDAAGWDIGNHTTQSTGLTLLTNPQKDAALLGCKAALDSHGLTRASAHVAYPAGLWDASVLQEMANTGMLTGRDDSGGLFDYKAVNPYVLTAVPVIATTPVASLYPFVQDAMNLGKLCVFMLHDLVAVPAGFDWSIANFQILIDWLAAQGIVPITISQGYAKITG